MSSSNGGCPGSAPVGVKKAASVPKRTSTARLHTLPSGEEVRAICVSFTKVRSHGAPASRVHSPASDPHCIPRALVAKQERTIDLLDIRAIGYKFHWLASRHAWAFKERTDREQTFRPNRTARLKAGTGWPRAAASKSNLCPKHRMLTFDTLCYPCCLNLMKELFCVLDVSCLHTEI